MHTATLYAYASAYGVDAVVEGFYSNLSALARHTCDAFNLYNAVVNLGHLSFKQTLQEGGAGARKNNLGVVVVVVNTLDDGTHGFAFVVHVVRNLL